METWGLPLSEFTKYNKPIIAVNLEYIKETLSDYPYIALFDSGDVNKLVEILTNLIENKVVSYSTLPKNNRGLFKSIESWEAILSI